MLYDNKLYSLTGLFFSYMYNVSERLKSQLKHDIFKLPENKKKTFLQLYPEKKKRSSLHFFSLFLSLFFFFFKKYIMLKPRYRCNKIYWLFILYLTFGITSAENQQQKGKINQKKQYPSKEMFV